MAKKREIVIGVIIGSIFLVSFLFVGMMFVGVISSDSEFELVGAGGNIGVIEVFGIIDFANSFKEKRDPEPVGWSDENTEAMDFGIGVRPTYFIDDNNAVSAEFHYPVMGDNTNQELLFGANYEGYIPF